MTNLFHKLNEYFICDPDEQAPLRDYIFFYGWIGSLVTYLVVTIVLNITF